MNKAYALIIIKDLYDRLKPVQKKMFKLFMGVTHSRKYVIHCSRRLGKTFLLCVIAIIVALSKDNAQIRYAGTTGKAVRKMIKPIFKQIFARYKPQYRPKWDSLEGAYVFANGSMVHVAGVNNEHEDDLRGTAADLCVVDEAAFVDNLGYLVDSVLTPQLINTGGKLIMASSSPLSPAHEFADTYILQAKQGNFYSSFTIDEGDYSQEIVDEFIREAGGRKSTTVKREYYNELIVDEEFALIPEFANCNYKRAPVSPDYDLLHKYVAMDLGVRDLNVTLFGYYDFVRAKLVIEREHVISGPKMTTPLLHKELSAIEQELWKGKEPYKRNADNNNPLLLLDLGSIHNMFFNSTSKDSLHAMINQVRVWIGAGRVEIDESCKILIDSLKFGVWNENRSEFGRSKTLGHFDAIAAIMYMIRNIDEHTNPIPVKVGFNQIDTTIDETKHEYQKLFGRM